MIGWRRSLRVQLVVLGFVAIVVPVLVVLLVSEVTETTVTVDGEEVTERAETQPSPWFTATVVALGPAAAGAAWLLAGRSVGRLERAADEQRRLIEEASHELRTPLAVLATNAEVLLAHPSPTIELYREGLERSAAAAARLQATVGELLVDARGGARTIARQPVDLVGLVTSVVEDARVLAAVGDVRVVLEAPASAPCAVDEPTVRRAIANLVSNAVAFAPAGTDVEVEVARSGGEAIVAVTDHGPGILPDDQPKVFERFWQDRRDGAGTGLGLPIARQVARAHGGDVALTSPGPAGDGCRVELRLRA